ncbi:hypothetical protein N7495_002730 [Penicillium taxi]|uniref:uncharacterized protein n=1 Tax=Penicillium taxi TaxID=168475 RepID=UPI0025453A7A|nr:uncharacterized protein N7495_002730 [Penicillium taxi]KAJ5902202.1 hypothetical protein N7495_002730 [Penicillium taxi]
MRLQPPSGTGTPIVESKPTIEQSDVEDVPKRMAIVGMSCRLPGQVSNVEEFWDLCSRGRSAWSPIPKNRFNADSFYHPNHDRPGCFNAQGAHFLDEDVGLFDAPFFNMTRQEACSLDPQQRIMLECVYEALENAGIPSQDIVGSNAGVFVGGSFPDYDINNTRDPEAIPMFSATGTAIALQSNRVSYYFDLHGPSITVDTACSASLTALHLAIQSIKNGECSIAIVGGCHLNLLPEGFVSMTRQRLLGASGKSFAFDHRASGFGRGEGAGCIILKSFDDAVAAGDAIRSVIVNSGINQDGRTRGIAMPNGEAQESLIRAVYKQARIDPSLVGYVEAHGTGTKVGDPLEATALNAVFGEGRTARYPLLVGSVKSNIGHLEGSSGLVSVIKTALMLERGFVLPNCNFEKANEEIPMDKWNMKVPKKLQPWPRGKTYASVNNFGFGGTNAHVIMQRGPRHEGEAAKNTDPLAQRLFVLSADDKRGALQMSKDLGKYLDLHPSIFEESLADKIAFTLGQHRSFLPWRLAVSTDVHNGLVHYLATDPEPVRSSREPTIGFVFTGQGAQWHGMGKELLHTYPIFQQAMKKVDTLLQTLGATFSIIDELLLTDATASSISAAYMSQPACTAVQLALVDLLASWGIRPKAVIGHSSGEIAGAYAAGILTLEESVRVAYFRGVAANMIAKDKSVQGAMLAVGANASEIQQILNAMRGQKAVIACVNSESSVTISGDREVVSELQTGLDKEGIFTRMLHVDVAYHSHHMQRVAQQYQSFIGRIAPQSSKIPFHSTVHGKLIPGSTLDASYWVANLVSRVEFVKGLQSLLATEEVDAQINTLIEIGPHPALQTPTKEIVQIYAPKRTIQFAHTLKRKVEAVEALQQLAATLFTQGMTTLNFEAINFPNLEQMSRKPTLLTNLPKYPWNHSERYWFSSRLGDNHFHHKFPRSDILGLLCMENIDSEPRWRNIIRAEDHPWIRQHRVQDSSVYPMTGYLAMAIEAISQQAHLNNLVPASVQLRDIFISRVLAIPDNTSVEMMLSMRASRSEVSGKSALAWHEFKVFSWAEGRGWDQHCRGYVKFQQAKDANPVDGSRQRTDAEEEIVNIATETRNACTEPVDNTFLYENIASGGVQYGSLFQGLSNISTSRGPHAMATISVPDTKTSMPHEHESDCIIHPVTLDLCSQMMWLLRGYGHPGPQVTHVPSHVDNISVSLQHDFSIGTTLQLFGYETGKETNANPKNNRIIVTNPANSTDAAVEIRGITLVPVSNFISEHKDNAPEQICYKLHWEPCFEFLSEETYRQLPRNQVGDGNGNSRMHQLNKLGEHWLRRMLRLIPEKDYHTLQSHHQKFYRWAQQTCSSTDFVDDVSATVIEQTRNMNGAGKLNCILGELLPEILLGKVDTLGMMLEDDMLNNYYRDIDGLRESYTNASLCMDKMAHQNPDLNILEIGAGTGGATLPILNSLGGHELGSTPRFSQYTYTDISPGFFEKAKTKFADWAHLMVYQTLDISADPVVQGFRLGAYDVVVACNVLHATPDINNTMGNIRALLKPGGKILLIEETIPKATHFPFALLPGWWLANDGVRHDGPLLTVKGWTDVLKTNDFSGVDFCVEEYPGASYQSGCLMISTANYVKSGPSSPGDIVIIGTESIGSLSLLSLESGLSNVTGIAPTGASNFDTADVNGKWCIFLEGMDRTILSELSPKRFQALQQLFSRSRGLLWVVRHRKSDPQSLGGNMAIGLARTVRSETGVQFSTLDLGDKDAVSDAKAVEYIIQVFDNVYCKRSQLMQGDMEFVLRHGHISVPRLVDNHELNSSIQLETPDAPPQLQKFKQPRTLRLTPGENNGLDKMYFTDDSSQSFPLLANHIEIKVQCCGLNFKDVLIAMGQLHGAGLGQECSGIVTQVGAEVNDFNVGDRVCAMSPGSLSTFTRCQSSLAWKIPDAMSWDIAASLPAVWCTAYYSLVDLGRLVKGENILIHAAAGGVGQASILLAKALGAKIFATVGSVEKKNYLMETYQLEEDQIFFSRDTSFVKGIQQATGGEGVDVALNSLGGDALQATFECVAPFGRFIELGKRDITQNARLEMAPFNKNISFASVDLGLVLDQRPRLAQRLLRDCFELFTTSNILAKWPVTTLSISDVETGFRSLQSGQVIGKMVLEIKDDAKVNVYPARKNEMLLNPDGTYIVVGGTSGIGLDLASWMPQKGAQRLVLVSRSGAATEIAQKTILDLISKGIEVQICRCDISSAQNVEQNLIPVLNRMPPVRGVIFGAMVLRDILFEKMKFQDYEYVMRPRIHGIWNLQNTLQKLNKASSIDFFITLSSAASFVGNMGQSAYAASGTFMAALAQYPEVAKMPCTTIDLPVVHGVGYLADDSKREIITSQLGTESIGAPEIRALVAAAFRNEMRDSCNNHCVVGFAGVKSTPAVEQPFWINDTKLSHLLRLSTLAGAGALGDTQANNEISPSTSIRACRGREGAEAIAGVALMQKLSSILMRPIEEMDPSAPISVYGLDSLVAIEIRNWITRELEANLQILEILTSDSIPALSETILRKSGILTPEIKTEWGLDVQEQRVAAA